jgi:hypothetical protein
MRDIESNIVYVIKRLTQYIPDSDVIELVNLVQKHGEYGIAMENLCSILEEKKISISHEIIDQIIELFREMGFGSEILSYYKERLKT